MGFYGIYPLVNSHIAMERSSMLFVGKLTSFRLGDTPSTANIFVASVLFLVVAWKYTGGTPTLFHCLIGYFSKLVTLVRDIIHVEYYWMISVRDWVATPCSSLDITWLRLQWTESGIADLMRTYSKFVARQCLIHFWCMNMSKSKIHYIIDYIKNAAQNILNDVLTIWAP